MINSIYGINVSTPGPAPSSGKPYPRATRSSAVCMPAPAWKRICARRRSDTGHRTIEYEPGQRKGIIEILHVMRFTPPPQPARHVPVILLEISISFQPPTALRRLRTEGPEALLCPPANDRMAFEQPGGRAAFVGGDGTALARGKVEGGNGGFTARPA